MVSPVISRAAVPDLSDVIRLERNDCTGIDIKLLQRTLTLAGGTCKVDGKTVTVPEDQKIVVPPCPLLKVRNEPFNLVSATEEHPFHERMPAQSHLDGAVRGLVVPGSIHIKTAGESSRPLVQNIDYAIDLKPDCIARLPGCYAAENESVLLEYAVYQRRIDTLVIDQNGKARLIKGVPTQFAPNPPAIPSGTVPLANILAEPMDRGLKNTDIMPIWNRIVDDPAVNEANGVALSKTKSKLSSGKPIRIAFCGDSITCGCSARPQENSYPYLLLKRLSARYPGAKIGVDNFCRGGGTSSKMFPLFLSNELPKKPDLIVIEFINDLKLDITEIKKNYSILFARARAAGSEVIVCLPHLVDPSACDVKSWQSVASLPYYSVVKDLALNNKIGIADVARRWNYLYYEGLDPSLMQANNFNHPNNRGHEIYAEELMKCLQ